MDLRGLPSESVIAPHVHVDVEMMRCAVDNLQPGQIADNYTEFCDGLRLKSEREPALTASVHADSPSFICSTTLVIVIATKAFKHRKSLYVDHRGGTNRAWDIGYYVLNVDAINSAETLES
ncbi:hypothetical protein PROFUN_02504 [Planoprotostelium fungivorum]|uniref:Uncharacterized protein n=1 Tax=Planoprotostelium fungivorum TaxID=1890364 RepID=A0A2P6MP88_9EUKA|nr:hypothetical protein PROFUN_02504 [Planoprotostelium fungivorum]